MCIWGEGMVEEVVGFAFVNEIAQKGLYKVTLGQTNEEVRECRDRGKAIKEGC